jgi:predicted RNA-binding protein YlqC (UPF0109 family)
MTGTTEKLRNFLQYTAVQLINQPERAELRVAEPEPGKLRFRLILTQPDVALVIGRNGFTASAIRSVMKAAAQRDGVEFTLQIHSHEEEATRTMREQEQAL